MSAVRRQGPAAWRQGLRYLMPWLLVGLFVGPGLAILSDDAPPPTAPGDAEYAAGLAAFQNRDWQGVLDHLGRVVARRPWNDQAYNLMGFAARQLGDYGRALAYYRQALDLNPYHRGALEYLGEAYLELGCVDHARETLDRLAIACKRALGDVASCPAWNDLHAAIQAHPSPAPRPCRLPPKPGSE